MLVFGIAVFIGVLVFASIARAAWQESPDLFAPGLVLVVYLAAAYLLDPVFISITRLYGFNDRYAYTLGTGQIPDLAYVVVLAIWGALAFALGRIAGKRLPVSSYLTAIAASLPQQKMAPLRSGLTIAGAFFITALALVGALRTQASSVADALRWIGNKQAVYEGRGYLLVLVLAFKASVLLWSASLFTRWSTVEFGERCTWVSAVLVMILIDLATGTRSNLLFSNVLVLLLLYHRLRRPISPGWVLVAVPVAFAVLIGVRVLTRDVFFRNREAGSVQAVVAEKLLDVPRTLLFEEVQGADAQLLALESPQTPPPLLGRTVAAVLTLPIPRAVFPDKPRGGNAWFTKNYFPVRYYSTRVEMTASFMTEMWTNFRLPGVLGGFLLLGVVVAIVDHVGRRRFAPVIECIYAISVWRFISLVRGDVFNWVINVLGMTVLLLLAYVIMFRGEPKLDS